jgi:hypothetical protein
MEVILYVEIATAWKCDVSVDGNQLDGAMVVLWVPRLCLRTRATRRRLILKYVARITAPLENQKTRLRHRQLD